MTASNENDWKKYQSDQMYNKSYIIGVDVAEEHTGAKQSRLIQSGIDPNESFNFVQGGILVGCVMAVIGVICWVLL